MDPVLTLKYYPNRDTRKEVEVMSPESWESYNSCKYVRPVSMLLSVKTIGKRLVRNGLKEFDKLPHGGGGKGDSVREQH